MRWNQSVAIDGDDLKHNSIILIIVMFCCKVTIKSRSQAKKFKWMDEAEKAFNEINKLLVSLQVLEAPTPDGLFRLESDTLRRCRRYITAEIRR